MTKPHVQRLLGAASLILAGCTSVAFASQEPSSKASAAPTTLPSHLLLGFPLYLSHYDNHWYWFLPRHPRFEMVEVMSRPRPGAPPLIWVFFTERAGGKRQYHYINDAEIAARNGWAYRDIQYEASGAEGQAQNLTVSMTDADGQPVELAMQFRPGTPLLRAGHRGLTNQSGHSADRLFMTFYRDTLALAQAGTAKLGGVNHAHLPDEPLGAFPPRYAFSSNIYIGITPYGRQAIPSAATIQSRSGGSAYTRQFQNGPIYTLTFDAADALLETRHSIGSRSMFVTYRPALSPCGQQTPPARSRFSISIDSDPDLIVGEATRRCEGGGSIIDYRPASPRWAAAQPFSVRQTPSPDGGGTLLTTHPLPR